LTIGWIGSPTTWKNVQTILPVLEDVCRAHEARFRAVGAGAASKGDGFEGLELVPWSQSTEILEVQKFDVGIMPLVDAPFERGKSGYKLVQYMACGIPSVGSPIGVNRTILEDGCGLLANSLDEWKQALEQLLSDGALRERMGKKARARAVEAYSLKAHAPRLIEFFKTVA
jgi:glycosyltransferase involved in cell wall biosynthesis